MPFFPPQVECSNGQIGYGRKRREIKKMMNDPNKVFEITLSTFIKVHWGEDDHLLFASVDGAAFAGPYNIFWTIVSKGSTLGNSRSLLNISSLRECRELQQIKHNFHNSKNTKIIKIEKKKIIYIIMSNDIFLKKSLSTTYKYFYTCVYR